jgi:hypothetical protein
VHLSVPAASKRGDFFFNDTATTEIYTVASRQLWRDGQTCSASTPCQLRVTSFASKCHLVDLHPLYVPTRAAPHVRASHYGLRFPHDSKEYDHGPKITTDWQDHYRMANAIG